MIRLLKIEIHKIFYSRTFWIILGLYIVLLTLIALGLDSILKSFTVNNGKQQQSVANLVFQGYSVFNFPGVWHNLVYLASWFKLLLAVLVVILVTNEYSYKTLRQNIIDGLSKWEVIWAKELVILILSVTAVIYIILLTLILGKSQSDENIFYGSSILISYFFSLILYLNFTYLLSSWLKKSGFVIGILFLYTLIIENLIALKLPEYITRFFPMNLINKMIPNPLVELMGRKVEYDFSILNIGVSVCYVIVFIALIHLMLRRGHAGKQ